METQKPNDEFLKKLDEIIEKTCIQGQLMIIATKQHGKSNATMWLLRRLMQTKSHEEQKQMMIIFDTVLNWRFKFDKVPYVDYESVRNIPMVQDLIVDIGDVDSNQTRNSIGEIVMNDFIHKRELKKQLNGDVPFQNIYLIEEIQNVLGTYAMNGAMGRFWLKMVSECANYGQVIIGLGQRLADISTKVIERSRYFLIGATEGDNDLKKIGRMVNSKELVQTISRLERGEFIFIDKKEKQFATMIAFPKFVNTEKPYPFTESLQQGGYVKRIFLGT